MAWAIPGVLSVLGSWWWLIVLAAGRLSSMSLPLDVAAVGGTIVSPAKAGEVVAAVSVPAWRRGLG
jgi:hypothetical protein